MLIYVDDLIMTRNSFSLINAFIQKPGIQFSLKDLGPFSYFLVVEVSTNPLGLVLSQEKYIRDILKYTNIIGLKWYIRHSPPAIL